MSIIRSPRTNLILTSHQNDGSMAYQATDQEDGMALDFEQTRDMAKKIIREREATENSKPLTEQQTKDIAFWVSEIEKYVKEYSNKGKQVFTYDCSKLDRHVFHGLARAFKDENPSFYVETRDGCQELKVDWSDKHEV